MSHVVTANIAAPLNGHHHWVGPAFAVVPYEPRHLRAMAIQPMQSYLAAKIDEGYAENVQQGGPAWTALSDGVPVCCAGFHEPWKGRAIAWAVLGDPGRDMRKVTRAVRDGVDRHPAERIEMYVRCGFGPGERWARLLGFRQESRMARFNDGADFWCFVRLRNTLW